MCRTTLPGLSQQFAHPGAGEGPACFARLFPGLLRMALASEGTQTSCWCVGRGWGRAQFPWAEHV